VPSSELMIEPPENVRRLVARLVNLRFSPPVTVKFEELELLD
jgi:hypothetical protein